jgi:hypothetical protein
MVLLISVVAAFLLMLFLAPSLGTASNEARLKGLGAFQTTFTLAGLTLIGMWYVLERPDAARLKLDQSVTGVSLSAKQALVTIEVQMENVGVHAAAFENSPYSILVQKVSPLDPQVLARGMTADANGFRGVEDANNWTVQDAAGKFPGLIAYRIGGADSGDWKTTHEGLTSLIQPKESDFYYFRVVVPCEPGLVVSISSRFRTIPGPFDRLWHKSELVWIKQSFLDLSSTCKEG